MNQSGIKTISLDFTKKGCKPEHTGKAMQTQRYSIASQIGANPLLWILMLMPIAAVGHWLALFWPSTDSMMNISSDFSQDRRSLLVHHRYSGPRKSATGESESETNRHFQIDLESGNVQSISDAEALRLVQNANYRISLSGSEPEVIDGVVGNALRRWKISHRGSDGRESNYELLLPGSPQILDDSYIVTASNQKLIALKLGEQNAIPIELELPNNNGVVFARPNSRQFWLIDRLELGFNRYLFELKDGELQKIGNWQASYAYTLRFKDQEVIILIAPDGSQEIRTLSTDELVPIDIDPSIDLSLSRWGLDDKTNSLWVVSGSTNINFEFGSWRRIPNAGLDTFWLHERGHGRSIFASQDMQSIACINDTSGERIWERSGLFPEFKTGLTLKALGADRILIYSLSEFGTLMLDRETGATISKNQPLWAIGYIMMGWVAIVTLWWIGWFARSVAEGGWAWLDCTCFLAISLVAMTGRILVSGEPTSETRFELRITQGLCAAGVALTVLWIVYGKTRWTLKILPPIALVAFVSAVVMVVFGLRSWAVGATVVTLLLVYVWMLLVAWLMRFRGLRLEQPRKSALPIPLQQGVASQSKFPLRDIFFLMAVVAVLCSVVRLAPMPQGSLFELGFLEGAVNCLLMAVNAIVASWCALSRRLIWVRWSVWLASSLLCTLLGVMFAAWVHKSTNYLWIVEYHGVVQSTGSIAVFFPLHAFRWRGWRFAT